MKTLITIGCAFAAATMSAWAEENSDISDTIKLATAYLDAYSTFEPERMAPFYDNDAIFIDPTSIDQNANGNPFQFVGKAAILKGLGDYADQFQSFSLTYDVERRYESNDVVVFIAALTYAGESADGQAFSGAAPIVTAVGVRDGKVISHTDYYDYGGNAVEFGAAGD